jgi:uncharacterized membrane protein
MEFKIKWWQLIFYEVSIFSLGVLVAIKWYLNIREYNFLFFLLFIICGIYTISVLKNQVKFEDEEDSSK